MEQGNHHSLILATVNPGYTDEVMETAREAGAGAGTVIRARWTDADEVGKFVGISLQAEKDGAGHRGHQPGAQRHPGGHQTTATACVPPPRPW